MKTEVSEGSTELDRCHVHSLSEETRCCLFARFIIHKFVTNLHKAAVSVQEHWRLTEESQLNVCSFLWERPGAGGPVVGGENFTQSPAVKTQDGCG